MLNESDTYDVIDDYLKTVVTVPADDVTVKEMSLTLQLMMLQADASEPSPLCVSGIGNSPTSKTYAFPHNAIGYCAATVAVILCVVFNQYSAVDGPWTSFWKRGPTDLANVPGVAAVRADSETTPDRTRAPHDTRQPPQSMKQIASRDAKVVPVEWYQVQPGDTLSEISQRRYGRQRYWRSIALINGVRQPEAIRAGDVLHLPEVALLPSD